MTWADREALTEEIFKKVREITATKGKEYAKNEDSLANFKDFTEVGIDPLATWYIYFKKHFNAVRFFIKTRETLSEPIEGRILDCITYLIILWCLLREKDLQQKTEDSAQVTCDFCRAVITEPTYLSFKSLNWHDECTPENIKVQNGIKRIHRGQ